MTTPTLRPYQRQIVNDIYASWNAGNRNVLAVAPTGAGKSVITSEIVHDFQQSNQRGVVIAHRNELVAQMSGHLARRGIWHRVIGPTATKSQIIKANRKEFGKQFVHDDAAISVGGIDTINARASSLAGWAMQQSFWIIDEAHHAIGSKGFDLTDPERGTDPNKWGKGVALFKNAIGLGVTASPCRADGQGLGVTSDGVFHDMVCGPNMRDLINMGALSEYDLAIAESDLVMDDSDVGPSGEFTKGAIKKKAAKSHIVGDVVTEYCKLALGKRAICFATDVERATEIAENFNAFGIKAAALSAKSNSEYRAEMIRRFRDGQLTVLVNVDLFGEGFDVPACEVVIMARPTMSLGMYLQQFGRALRPAPGKSRGLIIDHVGNWKRHGFPDRPHVWSLDRREKRNVSQRDPHDLKTCPGCGKPHELFHPKCPYCGYAPEPGSVAGRDLEMVEGNLLLLDRETLEQMRAATVLDSPERRASQAVFASGGVKIGGQIAEAQAAKIAAQQDLVEAIAAWAGAQRALGRSDGELYQRFYIATGLDVASALHKERKRQDYEKMAEQVRAWNNV